MPLRLALIPILLFSAPAWRHEPSRVQNRHVGVWTVRTSTDSFSGAVTCRLFAKHMDYRRGALVFHLPERIDTSTALYRVDGGPPIAAASELMEMARQGFAVYDDDLANPSGGLVRIPERRLIPARVVRIEAGAAGAVITFKIDGFGAALDAARAAGCSASAFDQNTAP